MKTIKKAKRKWVIEAAVGIELMREGEVWSSNGGPLPDAAQEILNAIWRDYGNPDSVELEIEFQSEGFYEPSDRETPPDRHEERTVNRMTLISPTAESSLDVQQCNVFEEIFQREIDEAELPLLE